MSYDTMEYLFDIKSQNKFSIHVITSMLIIVKLQSAAEVNKE